MIDNLNDTSKRLPKEEIIKQLGTGQAYRDSMRLIELLSLVDSEFGKCYIYCLLSLPFWYESADFEKKFGSVDISTDHVIDNENNNSKADNLILVWKKDRHTKNENEFENSLMDAVNNASADKLLEFGDDLNTIISINLTNETERQLPTRYPKSVLQRTLDFYGGLAALLINFSKTPPDLMKYPTYDVRYLADFDRDIRAQRLDYAMGVTNSKFQVLHELFQFGILRKMQMPVDLIVDCSNYYRFKFQVTRLPDEIINTDADVDADADANVSANTNANGNENVNRNENDHDNGNENGKINLVKEKRWKISLNSNDAFDKDGHNSIVLALCESMVWDINHKNEHEVNDEEFHNWRKLEYFLMPHNKTSRRKPRYRKKT
ncbi:unnamed protein product [Ambrosiozyma monospora]|uniref:Unnamed protein product n=1 Tax=Ambrosiozyma monospora TaxID=43982 RepID=A0ACB5SWT9_AMBMO|nr:unnamed protein product [Ambrosiozyma monospora]